MEMWSGVIYKTMNLDWRQDATKVGFGLIHHHLPPLSYIQQLCILAVHIYTFITMTCYHPHPLFLLSDRSPYLICKIAFSVSTGHRHRLLLTPLIIFTSTELNFCHFLVFTYAGILHGKTKRGTSLSFPLSLYVVGYICSTKGSSDIPFLDAATSRNTSNTWGTVDADLDINFFLTSIQAGN